jgi:aminopeptidase N
VVANAGGREGRILVEGGAAQAIVPGCGPLLINYGQAGYYRTLYSDSLLARLTQNYAQLRPIDQIGLLADNWALGLGGYQSPSAALDMVDAAPANANDRLLSRIAGMLTQIDGMYSGDEPHQALVRQYASAKLSPALRRLGWAPRTGESASDSVLRNTLIAALGRLGDRAVVTEANRRFTANDPSITAGPLRQTLLGIVAANADSATWDRLRAMARDERNPLVRVQLYGLLGSAEDPALAQRALDLALTDEPGATNSSQIIGAVAAAHPDLAFDFSLAHRDQVEPLIDSSSRSRFLPGLASGSADPAMIDKLRQYAERYMTPQSRAPADRAIASIQDRLRVRRDRLPDITRWFEARRS